MVDQSAKYSVALGADGLNIKPALQAVAVAMVVMLGLASTIRTLQSQRIGKPAGLDSMVYCRSRFYFFWIVGFVFRRRLLRGLFALIRLGIGSGQRKHS